MSDKWRRADQPVLLNQISIKFKAEIQFSFYQDPQSGFGRIYKPQQDYREDVKAGVSKVTPSSQVRAATEQGKT